MAKKYLAGVVAVLVLVLAVWLVPIAFAADGGSTPAPQTSPSAKTAPSQDSGATHQCDGNGSGSTGSSPTSPSSYQTY